MAAEETQMQTGCTCSHEMDHLYSDDAVEKVLREADDPTLKGANATDAGDEDSSLLSLSATDLKSGDAGNASASGEPPRKSSKELAKIRKREDKGMEHVMKALQSIESTDEKLSTLCKKYAELSEEHRTMQNTMKQTQRTLSVLAREKDQLQNDHSKAVLAKSKLEGLCRELQRHNRLVKEESAQRAKEDDERRKEVAAKFQTTINEIQLQMNDHYQKNTALREENIELTGKLKGLIEQYELREQHIDKVIKHKELEGQLYDAKLAQLALQLSEEKERNLQEKQQLLQEALDNQKKVMLLVENEKQLKAQVAMYQDKYDEFQQTLTKSNDVFQNFKNEMDKMAKKIKKLEKETAMYRQRWEASNKALLTMAEEKTRSEREVTTLQSKVGKLESLCRVMQAERKKFLGLNTADSASPGPDGASSDHSACSHSHESETGVEAATTSGIQNQPSGVADGNPSNAEKSHETAAVTCSGAAEAEARSEAAVASPLVDSGESQQEVASGDKVTSPTCPEEISSADSASDDIDLSGIELSPACTTIESAKVVEIDASSSSDTKSDAIANSETQASCSEVA